METNPVFPLQVKNKPHLFRSSIYDFQATVGVRRGRGGSQRESSLLPIGRQGVRYDSLPHGYALFIAIRIRVNVLISFSMYKQNVFYYPILTLLVIT